MRITESTSKGDDRPATARRTSGPVLGRAYWAWRTRALIVASVLLGTLGPVRAAVADVDLDLERYDRSCKVGIVPRESRVEVTWPLSEDRRARMTFELDSGRPLIRTVAIAGKSGDEEAFQAVLESADPLLALRVGQRELNRRNGWTIFFDRMQNKPHDRFTATLDRTSAVAEGSDRRATLTIGDVTAGPFRGAVRWTFFAGDPFVLQEYLLTTDRRDAAYLYDSGLTFAGAPPEAFAWHDDQGRFRETPADRFDAARPLAVQGRAVAARHQHGTLAVFPAPHRYFYPLDFSDNLKNVWAGPGYDGPETPLGFGIRHDPRGDNRFVPWFNAPPGTTQEMGLFLLVGGGDSRTTLHDVAKLTRGDRFAPLEGYKVFSSHYHVEHTRELLNAQEKGNDDADASEDDETGFGRLPSGGRYRIPTRLVEPGFARTFRRQGIDIVHLAEFHFGETPRMDRRRRLEHLELLHAECERLSDERFLLLPGEEPNVHLGGHWISFFPKPVYWVLNRPEDTPFVENDPRLGPVYHVGSEADVYRLLQQEQGLAWTAHPRIKSSTGFPDRYRDRPFFRSDRFLGAAWKAMPADLSRPNLGQRVLSLLDDLANWGDPKYVLGEVDVFKIEPEHELYGHMNVNYVRLDQLPRFRDGWQPLLDVLRAGSFFVTTGEVLIEDFDVDGRRSGEAVSIEPGKTSKINLRLRWTFPLKYAEVISGDGRQVWRERVDLSRTGSYGEMSLPIDVDLTDRRWVRVEVWDVATNGAFTQPVWVR